MRKWTGWIDSEDGTSTIKVTVEDSVELPPLPTGPVFPAGANTVTIGTASYPLSAIDPPTLDLNKPGGRDTDQLIIITKASTPKRNQFGWELGVKSGKIVSSGPNLAMTAVLNPNQLLVLDYVLSGHGKAADFLRSPFPVAATVKVTKEIVAPPVVTPPAAGGHPIMGAYWLESVGNVSQIGSRCNRALMAFYQGTGMVSWGGNRWNGLNAWRARGNGARDVLVSLGGQGGTVVLDQVDEGIELVNRTVCPVDGIDFDNEAFSVNTDQTLAICRLTAARLSRAPADFIVQFAPPGGREDAAIATAKAVQAAGFRVYLGQQLYETSISDDDVMKQTAKAVAALGAPAVLVGIMIGDSHNSWTVANAVSRLQKVKARWSDIGGAYLWESSRAGTAQVIEGVGATLGIAAVT